MWAVHAGYVCILMEKKIYIYNYGFNIYLWNIYKDMMDIIFIFIYNIFINIFLLLYAVVLRVNDGFM